MSERSATDFTGIASDAKNSLDKFFRIPLKEDAMDIINKMKKRNTNIKASSLGDLDERLLKILENDEKYMLENFDDSSGKIKAKSLFTKTFEDAQAAENKKPYENRKKISMFDNIERNAQVIKQYEDYVEGLKSIRELDHEFLKKLNTVYTQYKSSSDYMSRLVKRLLKHNFNYTDEMLRDVGTRVLILRQFLEVYGYDCVEIISSPKLEDVVKNEFEGRIENITDDIFKYLAGNEIKSEYDKEYIEALVEFQGIILYKSSTIQMTKELCEELCELVYDETTLVVKNKKTNQEKYIPKIVLTDFAKDGKAKFLKDCFYEPESFLVNYIKNYTSADINRIIAFTQKLNRLYVQGKTENIDSFSNFDESIRLSILFSNFLNKICSSEEMLMLFSIAFPKIVLKEGNSLEECITEEGLKTIKCIKQSNIIKNKEQLGKIRNLLDEGEKCLDAEDRQQYKSLLYKKIGERFNGATNPSKKDSLYKKINELLGIKRTDYRMLNVVDDLANARFSSQGKTREYIYIFAIAFGMTNATENTDLQKEFYKEDPRNSTCLTDIEKNLFFDYYSDNIVNNLPSVDGFNEKKSNASVDGYGINYKNFAEVTFLWCIKQKSMKAKEKLKVAYEIIEYCKKNGKSEEDFNKNDINCVEKTTQLYKGYYNNTGINITEKSDFKAFLIDNYPCYFNGNIMKVNGKGLAAGKELEEQQQRVMNLLRSVEKEMFEGWDPNDILYTILERDNASNDIARLFILRHYLRESKCRNCKRRKGGIFPNCYAFFKPYSWLDKDGNEQTISSCKDFCADKKCDIETLRKSLKNIVYIGDDCEGDFERRLTTLSRFCNNKQSDLKNILHEIEERVNINVLYLEKKDVSRTALLALCYFEMVLMNYLHRSFCESVNKDIDIKTFEEYYQAFCEGRTESVKVYNEETGEDDKEFISVYPGANIILEKAGYQKINSKNILDVYVIFLAFKDNYKKMFELPDASELIRYAEFVNKKLKVMEKEIELNRKNENIISKDR